MIFELTLLAISIIAVGVSSTKSTDEYATKSNDKLKYDLCEGGRELRRKVLEMQENNGGNLSGISYDTFVETLGIPNARSNMLDVYFCQWHKTGYHISCSFAKTGKQPLVKLDSESISDECMDI